MRYKAKNAGDVYASARLFNDVDRRIDHIQRTRERLQSALSRLSNGFGTHPSSLSSHILAVHRAISIT